ncbi:HAD-IB family hydrolase [Fulvivirga maritima]|uniref:HAD-IB family hydrolase n=1 Tax=Fulvivirga maritima TaxID=2904247 RepID=UPI001F1EBB3B|nr:HAD-IB family hydrolase [Fulvivirga maritima]UII25514.1 HAD-IB family hydrolase [Fulvivirga maritima]
MSKDLVLFDFDGTLTTKDTLLDFTQYAFGKGHFIRGMLKLLPSMVGLKLGVIPNWKAKEKYLRYFFGGLTFEELQTLGQEYGEKRVPQLIRKKALAAINEYKEAGVTMYIVSASSPLWIESWASKYGIKVVGTRLEISEGKMTGKIDGKNCYGLEKVNRIKKEVDLKDYENVYAYGDSSGDREMLQLATKGFYKYF